MIESLAGSGRAIRSRLATWCSTVDIYLISLGSVDSQRQSTHLVVRWGSNADEETTTPDRRNDLAGAIGAKDQSHVVHVLLHGSTQSCLRVSGKSIGLVDNDDLEVRSIGTSWQD